jgi:hypothetical protein
MGEHSLLSPSSAHRWMFCPASVSRCASYPEKTSKYAEEGTLAHDVAKRILKGEALPPGVTEEMFQDVSIYTDTVKAMSEGADMVWVEEALDLSEVICIAGEKGTGDYIALVGTEIQVHDLKFGKGVKEDAEGNWQLILYGLGALDLVSLVSDDVETVRLVIHQPRLNSVSEMVYTVEEMLGFREDLRTGAQKAVSIYQTEGDLIPEDCFNPGEKQCRFCLAKGECEALADFCKKQIVGDFDDLDAEGVINATSAVVQSTEVRLASLYGNLDLIKSWIKAVEETAMTKMLNGAKLPGYKLVLGKKGNRQWEDEAKAEETMKSMRLKKDEMYTFKVISPTVAEKLLKESVRKWNRIKDLIIRKPAAPTIVPEKDKRPEWASAKVENDFDDPTETDDLV